MKLDVDSLYLWCKAKKLLGPADGMITRISTDSKEVGGGCLFVPIIGERHDAHKFISEAYERGCRAVLSSREHPGEFFGGKENVPEDLTWIFVEDTLAALQSLAASYRKTLSIPFLAVTGSVGKTSTREMTALAFSADRIVYSTKGNLNSQIGVPLTILETDRNADLAVLEAGMSEFGEMARLSEMICPDGAMFTNIGDAHIGQLYTRENILREKCTLMTKMKKGSPVIVNGEDPLLTKKDCFFGQEVIYYATDPSRMLASREMGKLYYAGDIRVERGKTCFVAVMDDEEISVSLSVFGRHQVSNAMAALSAVKAFSGDVKKAARALEKFKGFAHRQQIFDEDGILVIDDTYNASPDSMRAALTLLRDLDARGKKVAVLGDMKELGEEEIRMHEEIASFIKEEGETDALFTLGSLAAHIGDRLKENGREDKKRYAVFSFLDRKELARELKAYLKKGDLVLFKASNSMRLFETIEEVFHGKSSIW